MRVQKAKEVHSQCTLLQCWREKKKHCFFLPQYSTSPRFPITFALYRLTQVAEQKQQSDRVCEIVVAPLSFQCDVWKHCGFPLSRQETGGKVKGSQETIHTRCRYARHWMLTTHLSFNLSSLKSFVFPALILQWLSKGRRGAAVVSAARFDSDSRPLCVKFARFPCDEMMTFPGCHPSFTLR